VVTGKLGWRNTHFRQETNVTRDLSTSALRCYQIHLGGDRNFHYLLGDPGGGDAVAVDPGFDAAGFAAVAQQCGLNITSILITHGHPDHDGAAEALAQLTGAAILRGDVREGRQGLTHGQVVRAGSLAIEALATPGHAPDHFCFRAPGVLVTGDLLFCGKVGGTGSYFPGSSARQEWESLQLVLQLPDDLRVLPGHDYYGGEGEMPYSTIGQERTNNPFLAGDFEAFCNLKDNWATYKQEHGIR